MPGDHGLILGDEYIHQLPDTDPTETGEWVDSFDAVVTERGPDRARFLMAKLLERAHETSIGVPESITTPYVNTISAEDQPEFPGDEDVERQIRRYIRWNAAVMVIKANHREKGIGGHLSTFASSATLYEVGFNHFFKGKNAPGGGDHVYLQGHAAPGIYARAFLEGRFDEKHLDNFRFEIGGDGLSSYPHPRLMPEFWEYPTVSMGIGPINSIYHARFNKYLQNRGLDDTSQSRVWCFIGDGETDEPESLGAISLATRERLDNLTWIINCNLQRLDGPVRGNGQIISELEAVFRGAGWNVIKVIWGTGWDRLLANDKEGALIGVMNSTVDGEYQRYKTEDGAYVREHFFGKDPRTKEMVADMTDDQIWALRRGGLDYRKVYAAYKVASELRNGKPTVILAKTIKGWTLGPDVEGRNATHQIKTLTNQQLMTLRETLHLHKEIPAESLEGESEPPYFRPGPGTPEYEYLQQRRQELGGPLPARVVPELTLELPLPEAYAEIHAGSGKAEASTTTAFTRLIRNLSRVEGFGDRIVPIVPDEARTFGMDSLFRELKIYASDGQLYESVDASMILSYTEAQDGQILEEGITEAGSVASWIAAATAYATRGLPMIPFFIFYSMFGFQRVGDLIWSAADSRARGFLLGATAGRTTLQGEGLQHQDGHSLVLATTVPVCEAYDPAFAYEVGTIIEHGLQRMYGAGEDRFYYLTLYNENYVQPPRPEGAAEGIIEGLYRWQEAPTTAKGSRTAILFSGSANLAAREAAQDLAEHYDVAADLWSATSYKKLREEALGVDRWNRLHPDEPPRIPLVTRRLSEVGGPVIAVTDFMKLVPDQVAQWVPSRFVTLGTDGFGRSDSRQALRKFFEIDAGSIVASVLWALSQDGLVPRTAVQDAFTRYGIDPETPDPAHQH